MREALGSLTTRGRAFLAAGVTALLCALVLGYDELVRVAALLVLLPLLSAAFLGRSRYRLGLVRTLNPGQVAAGQQAQVQLALTNDGRMPTGLLLLEEQLPYALGNRPRFVVDRMGPRWKRDVSYTVRSDVRGRFAIGPMTVRLSDPFGIVEIDKAFHATAPLVVTPRVTPLPAIPLSGAWTGSGDNRPRAFTTGSAEDVTVREYRRGDDLRRVHWRSSAHAGELMVRREEQPWQSRATILLDNRSHVHRGEGPASSLEHAVAIAASVGVHLIQRGFTVRLLTASGDEARGAWHERASQSVETAPLLESLAVLAPVARTALDTGWLQEPGHSGLLVAVLAGVGEPDRPALVRMRHAAAQAMAIVVDSAAWTGTHRRGTPPPAPTGEDAGTTVSWLGGRGWRAVAAPPEEPLPAVWQALGVLATAAPSGQSRHPAPRAAPPGEPAGAPR